MKGKKGRGSRSVAHYNRIYTTMTTTTTVTITTTTKSTTASSINNDEEDDEDDGNTTFYLLLQDLLETEEGHHVSLEVVVEVNSSLRGHALGLVRHGQLLHQR